MYQIEIYITDFQTVETTGKSSLDIAETLRKLYFLEPFVFPWPRCYASWAPLLSQMSVHIKKISQDHGAVFLPLQNDLDQEAARSGPASITSDGIHLTPQGHQILADKLYKLIISER